MRKAFKLRVPAAAAVGVAMWTASRADAQNFVFWDSGGGADHKWSTGSNWSFDAEPNAPDTAILNNGGTIVLDQPGEVATQLVVGRTANPLIDPADAGLGGTVNFRTGGALSLAGVFPSVSIGANASTGGTWNHDGGTLTTLDSFLVAASGGSTGNFTMSAGTINVSLGDTAGADDFIIGDNGNGTGTMTGGTINARDVFFIATQSGSVSSFSMSGGAINPGNDFVVGGFTGTATAAQGTFTHTGGDITIGDNYVVAVGASSQGTVTQSAGNVTAAGALIGENGKADYTLTGGTFNVTGGTNATRDHDESFKVSQSNATNDDDASIFRQQGGTVNVGTAASPFAPHMFLGDFDNSAGTYQITSGSLIVAGNLNVGAAIASNAAPTRVEPTGTNGAQGQALNANGTFIVDGSDGTITVGGSLLANPADKSPARRDGPGQANSSTLRFIFENTGVSLIDVAGMADLDGAVIDIVDPTGYLATHGAVTLIDAAGGFGNVFTVTPTEAAGTGEAYRLSAEDAPLYRLAIVPGGGGELLQVSLIPEPGTPALLGLGASGRLARRRRPR